MFDKYLLETEKKNIWKTQISQKYDKKETIRQRQNSITVR